MSSGLQLALMEAREAHSVEYLVQRLLLLCIRRELIKALQST